MYYYYPRMSIILASTLGVLGGFYIYVPLFEKQAKERSKELSEKQLSQTDAETSSS